MTGFGKRNVEGIPADPLQRASALMRPFAQTYHGVFILDGPAVERGPSPSWSTGLDVYCLFPPERMSQAVRIAQNSLATISGEVRVHRANNMSTFLGVISKRSIVIGDRRKLRR